jgi:hypothetical protein
MGKNGWIPTCELTVKTCKCYIAPRQLTAAEYWLYFVLINFTDHSP